MKLLIKNGLALMEDGDGFRTEKKDILIDGNRIAKIGTAPDGAADRVIDAADKLIMPGLINAHTHAYMTMHRNFADDLMFFDWLDKVQQVEDGMTVEDIYWATMLAIIEMIRTGTRHFAKRQMTFLRREENLRYVRTGEENTYEEIRKLRL